MLPKIWVRHNYCNLMCVNVLGFSVMSKQLDTLTAQLHVSGSLKVWSLIITFFGDSIVNRGGNVSANTVHTVLDRVDIGSGAVRTAFSRLASDGWVERQKQGRRSYFQLTKKGMQLFSDASQRIYAPVQTAADKQVKQDQQGSWLLGMYIDKSLLNHFPDDNAIVLPNRSLLVFNPDVKTTKAASDLGLLSVTGRLNDVPDWVVDHLCPADWEQQVQALLSGFDKLADKPLSDPLSCLAARTLLIHQWRRLLLRYPPIPRALKGQSLHIENEARKFVGDLYHQLTERAEVWLFEQGTCIKGALPNVQSSATDRFTNQYLKQG